MTTEQDLTNVPDDIKKEFSEHLTKSSTQEQEPEGSQDSELSYLEEEFEKTLQKITSSKEETTQQEVEDTEEVVDVNKQIEELFGGKIKYVDGEYVFKPSEIVKDGKKIASQTIYKADSLQKLLSAIEKGIVEKDYTIQNLKKSKTEAPPPADLKKTAKSVVESEDINYEKVEKPNVDKIREEVAMEVAKKIDFDPKYLTYTKEDWRQHEIEYGAVDTIELKQAVKEAIKEVAAETERRYKEQAAQYANKVLVEEETQVVAELLDELGIQITPEQYGEILEEVLDDEKSYTKDQTLKPGIIQLKVVKKLKPHLGGKQKVNLEAKLVEALNKQQNKVPSLKEGGVAKKEMHSGAKTVDEAKELILEEMKRRGMLK